MKTGRRPPSNSIGAVAHEPPAWRKVSEPKTSPHAAAATPSLRSRRRKRKNKNRSPIAFTAAGVRVKASKDAKEPDPFSDKSGRNGPVRAQYVIGVSPNHSGARIAS